jgi:hypothetical protein
MRSTAARATVRRATSCAAALVCAGAAIAQPTFCRLTDDDCVQRLGYAAMAETDEERVHRLRDVIAVDAGNPRTLESLARALMQLDGGTLEAAAVYERAYELQLSRSRGDYTWRFARNAAFTYERAGSPERADRLRTRVARDYGLAGLLEQAAAPLATDPATLDRALQDLCRAMTLTLFGGKPCLDSIDLVVAAADRAQAAPAAPRLEQTMFAAMLTAARSAFHLDAVDRGWRSRFESALERHIGAEAATRLRETEAEVIVE